MFYIYNNHINLYLKHKIQNISKIKFYLPKLHIKIIFIYKNKRITNK